MKHRHVEIDRATEQETQCRVRHCAGLFVQILTSDRLELDLIESPRDVYVCETSLPWTSITSEDYELGSNRVLAMAYLHWAGHN